MSRTLTAQDRSSLIKFAAHLPSGSAERKAILAGLRKASKVDVQAILRDHALWLDGRGGRQADLSGLDLEGADLRGANLERAILKRTLLTRANLQGANLRSATLTGALMTAADLRRADLTNADAHFAKMSFVKFDGAILYGLALHHSDISYADLSKTDPRGLDFSTVSREGTIFPSHWSKFGVRKLQK